MPLQEELEVQGNYLFKYRSYLPLIILVVGLAVYAYEKYTSIDEPINETFEFWWVITCIGVCMFGLIIRIYTVGHTPKNTSGRNTTEGQVADELNSTGIYSLVRHPLYVGNFFMWLGIGMLTQNTWFAVAFIFVYWVYYERIMYAEEQFLRKKFGESYVDWASKLPAFMPNFTNFKKAKYPFSWKKVLKKEKDGFFAVFITIYLFEQVGHFILHKTYMGLNWLTYTTIGAFIIYLILKVLKKFTKVFHEEGR